MNPKKLAKVHAKFEGLPEGTQKYLASRTNDPKELRAAMKELKRAGLLPASKPKASTETKEIVDEAMRDTKPSPPVSKTPHLDEWQRLAAQGRAHDMFIPTLEQQSARLQAAVYGHANRHAIEAERRAQEKTVPPSLGPMHDLKGTLSPPLQAHLERFHGRELAAERNAKKSG